MSELCREELMAGFREQVDTECVEHYCVEFGRLPNQEELQAYWEDYQDSDYRFGED